MADPEMMNVFLVGTAAGAGQGLGHSLMGWLLQRWRGLSGGGTPTTSSMADVANTLLDDEASFGAHAALGDSATPSVDSAATTSTVTATAGNMPSATPDLPPPDELLRHVEALCSPADWQAAVVPLQQLGLVIPSSAAAELARMQQQVLDGNLARSASLDRLAELTTRALEQAGVTATELGRWQRVADCLAREPEWDEPTTAAPVAAAVAQGARPQTWFAWTREELDQRLTTYLRRSIQRCGQACDQALRTLSDRAALRDLRSWKQELDLLDQWATSVPPLSINVRALRPLSGRGKEATRALEEAALVAERMTTAATTLFQQDPSTPDWTESLTTCRRATSQLHQHLRERRELR